MGQSLTVLLQSACSVMWLLENSPSSPQLIDEGLSMVQDRESGQGRSVLLYMQYNFQTWIYQHHSGTEWFMTVTGTNINLFTQLG